VVFPEKARGKRRRLINTGPSNSGEIPVRPPGRQSMSARLIHEDPWKLVHPSGFGKEHFDGVPKLELYNLSTDPRQQDNIAAANPEVLQRLKTGYEAWFKDVSSTRPDNYAPPRIVIGTDHETRTVLTRQDWRHQQGRPWGATSNGFWLLEAPEPTNYEVEIILAADLPAAKATITAGATTKDVDLSANQRRGHLTTIKLPAGKLKLAVDILVEGKTQGPHQVILTRN